MGDYLSLDEFASIGDASADSAAAVPVVASADSETVAASFPVHRVVAASSLLRDMEHISYEDGKPGYLYFRTMYRGMELTAGIRPLSLLQKKTQVHLIVEDETRGLRLVVEGDIAFTNETAAQPETFMNTGQIAELKDMIAQISAIVH